MPELPEVEVVRLGLAPAVTTATVASVTIFDSRSLRRHDGPAEDFVDRLVGRTMLAPQRRGKFLWIPLSPVPPSPSPPLSQPPLSLAASHGIRPVTTTEIQEFRDSATVFPGQSLSDADGVPECPEGKRGGGPDTAVPVEALTVHLGMSGQVLLRDRSVDDARTRIRIDIVHPALGLRRLNFVDQRIFGSMALDVLVSPVNGSGPTIPSRVAHIARDPLDEFFDDRAFLTKLAAKRTTIKRAILDQTLISGIGNIYADEALWAARIHYNQPTATLGRARGLRLLREVRAVLVRALGEGGTSFDTQYLNVNGQSGYFARSLNAYGQQGKPCPRCGQPIVRESFMNRGSHLCTFCQRIR